jgi:hypothetical protein
MKKYIIRNKKVLIVNKPRKLTKDMGPKDMAPEYPEKQHAPEELHTSNTQNFINYK